MTTREAFDQWLKANPEIELRTGEHEQGLMWLAWQAAIRVVEEDNLVLVRRLASAGEPLIDVEAHK